MCNMPYYWSIRKPAGVTPHSPIYWHHMVFDTIILAEGCHSVKQNTIVLLNTYLSPDHIFWTTMDIYSKYFTLWLYISCTKILIQQILARTLFHVAIVSQIYARTKSSLTQCTVFYSTCLAKWHFPSSFLRWITNKIQRIYQQMHY